jgi:hypothetical protein
MVSGSGCYRVVKRLSSNRRTLVVECQNAGPARRLLLLRNDRS